MAHILINLLIAQQGSINNTGNTAMSFMFEMFRKIVEGGAHFSSRSSRRYIFLFGSIHLEKQQFIFEQRRHFKASFLPGNYSPWRDGRGASGHGAAWPAGRRGGNRFRRRCRTLRSAHPPG